MKKKCLSDSHCPIARAYDAIGDWWSLLILSTILLAGARRFGEIQQTLGMARNILSSRLSKLVKNGILIKVPASDGTNYFEYAATEMGEDLLPALVALRQWGERYFFDSNQCRSALVSREKGELIRPVTVCSKAGRELRVSDLKVIERDS
ncbi:MAG: helix-turn-helix transcriptional regulator [Bdellovibrionales bacterium]|nr:helix-turn-helix transcriptional regulator [Bdellovibrionales bacterium]